MQRSSSVSVGPSTPIAQRGGITLPVPVDVSTRARENETKAATWENDEMVFIDAIKMQSNESSEISFS